MSRAARSLFVFGIYLCGLGLILLLVPNLILQFFGVPPTVDIAHRTSFFYSFASLVIARLIEFSPFSEFWQVVIVAAPLLYFTMTVIGYMKEGFLNRTENLFSERNFITTWFMYGLIFAEIGGLILILYGFIDTQFFR